MGLLSSILCRLTFLDLTLSSPHTHAHTPRHTSSLSPSLCLGQLPIPPCPHILSPSYSHRNLSGSDGSHPATYSHTPTHEHLHPPSVSSHPYPDPSLSPRGPSTPLPPPPVSLSLGPAAGRHTLNHSPPASSLPSRTLARMPRMGFCSEARRAQLPSPAAPGPGSRGRQWAPASSSASVHKSAEKGTRYNLFRKQ